MHRLAGGLALFALGLGTALTLTWVVDGSGGWHRLGIDPEISSKWTPSGADVLPRFYQRPNVPTGRFFFRRSGPYEETSNVLKVGSEFFGITDHPYDQLPEVRIQYGRYGFRSEYPAAPGGTALVGASYAEAGFANAEHTIVGWLRRDYDVAAVNFGVSYVGGLTIVHYLKTFVLVEKPSHVVWIFAERWGFGALITERNAVQAARRPRRQLGNLGRYVVGSLEGFSEIAAGSGLEVWQQWTDPLRLRVNVVKNPGTAVGPPNFPIVEVGGREYPVTLASQPSPELVDQSRPVLAQALSEMAVLCAQHGATLGIVYLPSREYLFSTTPDYEVQLPENYGFRVLQEEAAARQIWIIDGTAPLRQALAEGQMIINPIFDSHLNSDGMRVIAHAIAQQQKTP